MIFNLEFLKEEGGFASVFSHAVAPLEYAATSALNIAQRSASWLACRALKIRQQWSMQLPSDDDTVAISGILFSNFSAGKA